MSVYIHVPFCRNKCFYCGFYSVASPRLKDSYIGALCREIELTKNYLPSTVSETLYFGGGTPSYLELDELEKIISRLENVYTFTTGAERTIEMNPEDATLEKLRGLKQLGFNRLSIGVQSFHDDVLKRINRTHSATQAMHAVELAAQAGFENTGMDLIIGLPGQTIQQLERDLEIINSLQLSHLSIYILSIDSNSVFEKLLQKGELRPDDDDVLAEKYMLISNYLESVGFEHYEISNFARGGKYAMHNTAYWQQKPYIGLGPSAHSYNGVSRQWNVANIKTYIESLDKNTLNFEKEDLSEQDRFNELIMTGLRTMWGIGIEKLEKDYQIYWRQSEKKLLPYIQNGHLRVENGHLRLTTKGWLISDSIFSDLFV